MPIYIFLIRENFIFPDKDTLNKLWTETWSVNDINLCKDILLTGLETEILKDVVKRNLKDKMTLDNILFVSISSFLTFCDRNWSPYPAELAVETFYGIPWPKDIDSNTKLQRDSEPLYVNILHPELLYFSTQVFNALCCADQSLVSKCYIIKKCGKHYLFLLKLHLILVKL